MITLSGESAFETPKLNYSTFHSMML